MFTTIIPTYQRAHLLRRAIGSALGQTYRDLRVIVYDNASTDGTEAVVRELAERDSRVTYYRHPQNIGGAANIAFAMERVATPFFSILCDDDVVLPEFYEIALREFDRFPSAMFVGASTLEISEAGKIAFAPAAFWDRTGLFDASEGLRRMAGGKHPTMTTVVFRRRLVDAIGAVDPAAGALLDLDYYIRACREYPCAITRDVAGFFVRHAGSWTNANPSLDRDFAHIIDKAAGFPRLEAALRAQRNFSLFHRAVTALADGDWARSLRYGQELREHGAIAPACLIHTIATLARFAPPISWSVRQAYALQLRMLGYRCVARLRRMHVRGAENGFRAELAYFKAASTGA